MKLRYYSYILNALLLIGIVFFLTKKKVPIDEKITIEYVPIEVPKVVDSIVEIRVPVPVPQKETKIDSTWYNKYVGLKEQSKKDSLFKESIKENEYLETYEDEKIKIDVFTKTRGEIKEQNIPEYIIKPSTVLVPQVTITKAEPPKVHVYGGIEVGIPTTGFDNINPVIKGNILIQGKKGNMITGSYDTNKTAWIGKVWKFW